MMTPEMAEKVKRSVIGHEGMSNFPYEDTLGNTTIGIGYNLTTRGLPDEWINKQYLEDVNYFYQCLSQFVWFHQLNTDRQIALIDMAFMGWKKFLSFRNMLQALSLHNYERAADEMLDSLWASQVKGRAQQLADAIRSGVYNI